MIVRRRAATSATAALCALALAVLAACSSDSPVAVVPPAPAGTVATACTALAEQLPEEVDGSGATGTTPDSPYTAAWGDVVLTCGGAAPSVEPTAQLVTVDEVDWYPQPLPQGGTRFSTVGRAAVVTVTVPITHQPEVNVLVDLSGRIRAAVPAKD